VFSPTNRDALVVSGFTEIFPVPAFIVVFTNEGEKNDKPFLFPLIFSHCRMHFAFFDCYLSLSY